MHEHCVELNLLNTRRFKNDYALLHKSQVISNSMFRDLRTNWPDAKLERSTNVSSLR